MKLKLIVASAITGALIAITPGAFAADSTPNDESAVMKTLDPAHAGTVRLAEDKESANPSRLPTRDLRMLRTAPETTALMR